MTKSTSMCACIKGSSTTKLGFAYFTYKGQTNQDEEQTGSTNDRPGLIPILGHMQRRDA